MYSKWGTRFALAAVLFASVLACRTAEVASIAQPTVTPSRTPRPTYTPIPTATDTPVPTETATPAPTAKPTKRPTPRPPTPKPQPITAPQPTASPFEFHANPPFPCTHSGLTYLKGTVYLDKNDPNSKYVGAIVALGPPDASTIYTTMETDSNGEYSFILSDSGQPHPGTWGIWLVDPSDHRKSDIGGPIVTNSLGADDPNSCWTSGVDFWK